MQDKIAVVGGGSWGTALSNLAASNGIDVTIYVKEDEVVHSINKEKINHVYLPNIVLEDNLTAEPIDRLADGCAENIIWAVPTQFTRYLMQQYKKQLDNKSIIFATKGIEIGSDKLVIDIADEILDAKFSVISGPSFAKEVALKKPTAISIGSKDSQESKKWQQFLSNKTFRCYTTGDIIGLEIGGALKNVIAIAVGISDGLGFGNNARAGLITRGLAEITRLGVFLGAKQETFMGLSGMGDLVLTCTGDLSRNRQVGLQLAKGLKIEDIQKEMKMVAEGVATSKAAVELSKKIGLSTPISEEVYKIIYEGKNPFNSVLDLMNRPLKEEAALL